MSDTAHAHIHVRGRVQGVGYRAFAWEAAARQGVTGGVRNLSDGRVELEVEGEKGRIERLLEHLRTGPPAARVEEVQVIWKPASGRYSDFRIWY